MLSELTSRNKIVGIKQLRKALKENRAEKVFVAMDADPALTEPMIEACRAGNVPVETVNTMQELGKACEIEVGAAVAALLRN